MFDYNYEDMNLEELYSLRRKIEDRLEKYVGDERGFHTGDSGYQEMLDDLDDIEYYIEKKESTPKNNENKMENLMSFDQFSLNEKKKPSEGLTKKQKSDVVKKAKKGEDIGKKGKNFKEIVAKAKKAGAKDPEAVAASSMWKNIKR